MRLALLSLVIGTILGYLAQRSRMCFIGGLRDFILVRDTELLKGAIAFFVTAWLAFSVAGFLGQVDWQAPEYQGSTLTMQRAARAVPAETVELVKIEATARAAPRTARLPEGVLGVAWPIALLTLIAGLLIGLFSTLANGCPTRQHVMAAQGIRDSIFYLAGFYLGVIFYYLVTKPLLAFFI